VHSSSEVHDPATVTLVDPDDDATDDGDEVAMEGGPISIVGARDVGARTDEGEGLAMDESPPAAVGASVAGGEVDGGHEINWA